MENDVQMYQVFIRTTPEKLWQALTARAHTSQYLFNETLPSDCKTSSERSPTGPARVPNADSTDTVHQARHTVVALSHRNQRAADRHRDRVRLQLAAKAGSAPVDGLQHRDLNRMDVAARREAKSARPRRSVVGQDVPEQVVCDDH